MQFQVIGKFDATEIEPAFTTAQTELTSLTKETRSLRHALIAQNSVQLISPVPDLPGTLPPKAVCDDLVHSYFRTFEPIYRIIHVPTFWRDYLQFWERPGSTSTPTHFVMKLVVILAIGTTFIPVSTDIDRTSLLRQAQTWIYAAQWWLTGPSEKSTATLDGLQVFCLLILARQATHNCPGGSTWLSAGSLVTMAQAMGLHRTPKIFPSLSPFHFEMRARLWTTVLELVCMSSLDSALPPCISADDFDTNLPSDFDDQDLDPAGSTEQLSREAVTDSPIQILLAKSLPLRLRVVHLLNDFRSEQSYQTALRLGAELRAACRDVASFFHSSPPRSTENGSALRPTDFHRKFLDIYLRKYILLLHRPFMLEARRDPRFYLARKVCVESATVIGSYSGNINLDSETGPADDLARLSMVGRGVFKCALSLDIIIVLALEVITQLEEEGPHQSVPDPLDEINRAGRASLIQILERISDQLLRIISTGSPSLKRYLFVSAYLSHIRAMESGQSGQSVKQVVYEAFLESLKKCHSFLQAQAQRAGSTGEEALGTHVTDATTAPFYQLDMGSTVSASTNLPPATHLPATRETDAKATGHRYALGHFLFVRLPTYRRRRAERLGHVKCANTKAAQPSCDFYLCEHTHLYPRQFFHTCMIRMAKSGHKATQAFKMFTTAQLCAASPLLPKPPRRNGANPANPDTQATGDDGNG
jgi:hypothetical protein